MIYSVRKKHLFVFFLLSAWLFALSNEVYCQTPLNYSKALGAIIQQAEQTYATAHNTNMQYLLNNIPLNAAILMGLAMHGQKLIIDRDPSYKMHYEALREEAHEFLNGLAQAHNFQNPFDHQPLPAKFLQDAFDSNASGQQNNWAIQNNLPNPALVQQPLVLNLVTPESLGKLHLRDDSNSINLLGQIAPPANRNWNQPQNANSPGSDPGQTNQAPISPTQILGRWQMLAHGSDCGTRSPGSFFNDTKVRDSFLTFTRGNGPDLYVGRTEPGAQMIFKIRSQKQVSPYIVEFSAICECPHGEMKYIVDGQKPTISLYYSKNGRLILCRGKMFSVLSSGYIKVGQ
ncbi:MAG: hypothetical protein ACOYXC_03405 [Candidatus Rifleibacteriota bacterium]